MFVRQGVQIWLKVVPVLSAEIGDNFCHGHLIESGKAAKKTIFKQIDWQELSKPLIKKPTCFKIGFLWFLDFYALNKYLIFILIYKCIAYNIHYVK